MDDRAPPPYSLVASTTSAEAFSSAPSEELNPRSLTSYLHSHLAAIPGRMRQTQQEHQAEQVEADIWILDHLAPIVESFLADLGAQRTAPALATLSLVPKAAVPADAQLSGVEDMLRRNEVGRIARVDVQPDLMKTKGQDLKSVPPQEERQNSTTTATDSQGFTDWGRWEEPSSSSLLGASSQLLWWRDEALARRLASYLQPQNKNNSKSTRPAAAQSSPVQVAVERSIPAEKSKKSWGWGRRGKESNASPIPSTAPTFPIDSSQSSVSHRAGTVESGDLAGVITGDQLDNGKRAEMNVTAEELAFRRENDFGIWESMSGWAIVVTVKIYT